MTEMRREETVINAVEMRTYYKNTALKQKNLRINFQNIIYSVPGPQKGKLNKKKSY